MCMSAICGAGLPRCRSVANVDRMNSHHWETEPAADDDAFAPIPDPTNIAGWDTQPDPYVPGAWDTEPDEFIAPTGATNPALW